MGACSLQSLLAQRTDAERACLTLNLLCACSSELADLDELRALVLTKRPELAKGTRLPWGGTDQIDKDQFALRRFLRASKGKDRVAKAAACYLSYLEWREREKVWHRELVYTQLARLPRWRRPVLLARRTPRAHLLR